MLKYTENTKSHCTSRDVPKAFSSEAELGQIPLSVAHVLKVSWKIEAAFDSPRIANKQQQLASPEQHFWAFRGEAEIPEEKGRSLGDHSVIVTAWLYLHGIGLSNLIDYAPRCNERRLSALHSPPLESE